MRWMVFWLLVVFIWSGVLAIVLAKAKADETGDLVSDLGSVKYIVREKAMKSLRMRMDFKLYVELRVYKPPNLEVGRRIEQLRKEFEEKFLATQKFEVVIDYPELPWICLADYYDYYDQHLIIANQEGKYNDGRPKWTNWRVATKLWLDDELSSNALNVLRTSKDEKEFKSLMSDRTKATIVPILNKMIEKEDRWWEEQEKEENPLRKKALPDS